MIIQGAGPEYDLQECLRIIVPSVDGRSDVVFGSFGFEREITAKVAKMPAKCRVDMVGNCVSARLASPMQGEPMGKGERLIGRTACAPFGVF